MASRITPLPISGFQGERTDYPALELPSNYLTTAQQAILYRGKIIRVSGYIKHGTAPLVSPVQRLISFQQFFGGVNTTIALVKAMESNLYVYNPATADYQDATTRIDNGNNDGGSNIVLPTPYYGGSKDLQWSGCVFVGASNLQLFYCTNYGYYPQVWNGNVTDHSSSPVSITTVAVDSNANPSSITGFYEIIITKSGHGFQSGDVIEIQGITVSGTGTPPNGIFQIYVINVNNFKYQVVKNPLIGGAFTANGTYWKANRFGNAIVPSVLFKAKVVRSFMNHLVYINVFDGKLDQPFTWWRSDVGTPWSFNTASGSTHGTLYDITQSYDCGFEADPTGGDKLVTGEPIGTYFAIYKDRSILLDYYSGQASLYWQTQPQVNNYGAFSSGSVINMGNLHYFIARNQDGLFDSFRYFDGTASYEIDSSKGIRDKFRNILNETYPELVYGTYISKQDQFVWIFPSTATTTYPDTAVIWNRSDDTWSWENLNKSSTSSICCMSEFELATSTTINQADWKVTPLVATHTGLSWAANVTGTAPYETSVQVTDSGHTFLQGDWIQVINSYDSQNWITGSYQLSSVSYSGGVGVGYSYIAQAITKPGTYVSAGAKSGTLDVSKVNSSTGSHSIIANAPAYPVGSSYWEGKQRLTLIGDNLGQVYTIVDGVTSFDGTAVTLNVGRQDFYLDTNDKKNLEIVTLVEIEVQDVSTTCTLYFQLGWRKGRADSTVTWGPSYPINVVPGKNLYYVPVDLVNFPPIGKLFSWNIFTNDTNIVPPIEQITFYFAKRGSF